LTFLIEDLLVISELESGRVKLNLQALRLGPLFEKTLEDYRSRAETRQVQLFDSTGGELLVHADPNRVDQVIAKG